MLEALYFNKIQIHIMQYSHGYNPSHSAADSLDTSEIVAVWSEQQLFILHCLGLLLFENIAENILQ